MNRSLCTSHAVMRLIAPALLCAALPILAQTDESGFPRADIDKKNGLESASAPAAKPAAPPANAAPLSDTQKNKAVTYKGSKTPPADLSQVNGHFTPYSPPKPKEGEAVYTIAPADTLWDLAQKNYGSPLYWPVIWELNDYIKDAHWIYPGDPLKLKSGEVVLPKGNEGLKNPRTDKTDDQGLAKELVPEMGLPPVYMQDMYCSGYIAPEFAPPALRVMTFSEDIRIYDKAGGYAFLNQGKAQGIVVGTEYAIIRPGSRVVHPTTHIDLGLYVQRVGRGRVAILADNTAVFEITHSCEAIKRGDSLVPFETRAAPFEIARRGEYPVYDPPNGKKVATVVMVGHSQTYTAEHDLVYLNIGSKNEIAPGDRFMIYRSSRYDSLMAVRDTMRDSTFTAGFSDRDLMRARAGEPLREQDLERDTAGVQPHRADDKAGDLTADMQASKAKLPRRTVAEIVVLDTTASTATCRVIHSQVELQVGDLAEMQ